MKILFPNKWYEWVPVLLAGILFFAIVYSRIHDVIYQVPASPLFPAYTKNLIYVASFSPIFAGLIGLVAIILRLFERRAPWAFLAIAAVYFIYQQGRLAFSGEVHYAAEITLCVHLAIFTALLIMLILPRVQALYQLTLKNYLMTVLCSVLLILINVYADGLGTWLTTHI